MHIIELVSRDFGIRETAFYKKLITSCSLSISQNPAFGLEKKPLYSK